MGESCGWVMVYRQLLENPIWTTSSAQQKVVLQTILLMVNHKSKKWEWAGEKFVVKAGQCITSLESIKQKAGKDISIQNIRSALKKFEKYEFLTNKSTKTGRLITIENWCLYQCVDEEGNKATNKEVTKTQQSTNKEVTTNNNVIMNKCNNDNIYKTIIDYLNLKTQKQFKETTKKTKDCIKARVNEGFVLEDFKNVIDIKVSEWKNDEYWSKYLRPETLFGVKFEGYLNQKSVAKDKRTDEEMAEALGMTLDQYKEGKG